MVDKVLQGWPEALARAMTIIVLVEVVVNYKTRTILKRPRWIKKIEEKLPEDLFLKIHRSYIINFKKIIDIEDNSVLIAQDVIPISRSNRPILMKKLNLL